MGLFRPYERNEADAASKSRALTPKDPVRKPKESTRTPTPPEPEKPKALRGAKKDRPTPTRKAVEAAQMERLHPNLTKREARKKARAASRAESEERWQKFERSPERQLVRDFVDSRWTLTEFILPTLLIFMAGTMFLLSFFPEGSLWLAIALWVVFIGSIINVALLWRKFKIELRQRHKGASTRGLLGYMLNRAMMIRRFRQPGPRIARGEDY